MEKSNKVDEVILAAKILPLVGGVINVVEATNCMTRLRLTVKDASLVKTEELKKLPGVLGLICDGLLFQIVLGPGVVRKVTSEFNDLLSAAKDVGVEARSEEKKKKQLPPITGPAPIRFFKHIGRGLASVPWKRGLRHLANIFSPLIPGFITFGILFSITNIILVSCSGGGGKIIEAKDLTGAAAGFYWFFYCLAFGFMSYLSVFVGINSAKEFKATPTIGGILGGIAIVPKLIQLAISIGWDGGMVPTPDGPTYPLTLIGDGRGGVFTVIVAVLIISYIERIIHKKMPNVLDTVFSPLLTILIGGAILIFAVMPVMGFVSNGITNGFREFSNLPIYVRGIAGFFMAAIFLPIIMLGLHHGLTSIYVELKNTNILYPILAMNDASQAGVGFAIWLKARKYKHERLKTNAAAGVIPEVLGVSEPLIYGVTLPLVKPFIPTAIGAAIGGAFIAAMGISFSGFDVSGVLGVLLATGCSAINPNKDSNYSTAFAPLIYFAGWFIAAGSGFIAALLLMKEKDLDRMPRYDTFVTQEV